MEMKYVYPISIRLKATACGVYIRISYFCTRSASDVSPNEYWDVLKFPSILIWKPKIQTTVCIPARMQNFKFASKVHPLEAP